MPSSRSFTVLPCTFKSMSHLKLNFLVYFFPIRYQTNPVSFIYLHWSFCWNSNECLHKVLLLTCCSIPLINPPLFIPRPHHNYRSFTVSLASVIQVLQLCPSPKLSIFVFLYTFYNHLYIHTYDLLPGTFTGITLRFWLKFDDRTRRICC